MEKIRIWDPGQTSRIRDTAEITFWGHGIQQHLDGACADQSKLQSNYLLLLLKLHLCWGHVLQQHVDGACADRSQLDEYLYLSLGYISSVHYGLITLTIKTGQSINKLIPVPNLSNSNYQELLNTVFRIWIRIGSVFGIRIPFQESKNDPQK